MDDLGEIVRAKLALLIDGRAALDSGRQADADVIAARTRTLKAIADLVVHLLDDPGSRERRLADINLLLNELFDEHVELDLEGGQIRGKTLS
jgi:hypothetical protein